MTTAHRPTWKAAVGKAQEGGWAAGGALSTNRSVLDAPSHTKLKTRSDQYALSKHSTQREYMLKQSLLKLKEMEEKNTKQNKMRKGMVLGPRKIDEEVEEEGRRKLLMSQNDIDDVELKKKYDDADADDDNNNAENGGGDVDDILQEESDLDASDSDDDNSNDDDDSDDDDDDDDSDDEEDLLQAELAKIKAEREKAKAKADAEAAKEEQERLEEAALIGNPLLNVVGAAGAGGVGNGGKMKRKWNDDVVFRNQAKGEPEMNKKRFINDTVRNDFHKRFLNKFIK